MAKEIEQVIELFFPFKGLSQVLSYSQQPPLTSSYLLNVRVKGPEEERSRGGQRAGLTKWSSTQLGGNYPVIVLAQITTTYVTPS